MIWLIIGSDALAQNNTIYYTTNNDCIIGPNDTDAFGAKIISNTYNDTIGCLTFDGEIHQIGDGAFQNCRRITSVILPPSVLTIGRQAFLNCSNLTQISLPSTICSIAEYAFCGCRKLELDIQTLEDIKAIKEYAFLGCSNISGNVSTLGQKVKISQYTFVECPKITGTVESSEQDPMSFRFLTWNIEGLAWKKVDAAKVDSALESKKTKQLIAKYQPRVYTLNEVPAYLSKEKSAATSGVNLICGTDEDKIHSVIMGSGIHNVIVTDDILLNKEDQRHSRIYNNHGRHFGLSTQYIQGKKVAIAVVHLEPTPKSAPIEKKQQIDSVRLAQAQDVAKAIAEYDYAIVSGDFNCSYYHNGEQMGGVLPTFTDLGFTDIPYDINWLPDHIFVKGFEVTDKGYDNRDLKLSDHIMLWADLKPIDY